MSKHQGKYAQRFGKEFEKHIAKEVGGLTLPTYSEHDLRTWRPRGDEMHPDALIAHPKCNIFVEIKSGLYSETVMTVGNSEIFKNRVKEIIKGIQQAREASNYIRNSQNAPKSIKEQESEFLLLVTNVQLFIGNGLRLRDMLSDQDRSLQKKGDNERIPAKNIFLLTSDELEWLFAAARVNS